MDTTWSPYFTQPFFFNKQQNMWANRFQPTRPYPQPPAAGQPTSSSKCFQINKDTCQVNINLQQQTKTHITVWGQATDCCGQPLEGCCITLCRQCECNGCNDYQPVQQTVTDCHGYYKFHIAPPCCQEQYEVLIEAEHPASCGGQISCPC